MFAHIGLNYRRRTRWLVAAATVCAVTALPAPTFGADAPNEESLKAAFLFNFAQFTRWPADAPAAQPIKFCLFEGSMAGEARGSLVGKMIAGRPTIAEAFEGDAVPPDCNVLYLSSEYGEGRICAVAGEGAVRGVLTVSDMDGFDRCGGHITLTTINNRLRFVVNLGAVQQSNLTLSAQLLELAIVR
jgi:hypothetical protein